MKKASAAFKEEEGGPYPFDKKAGVTEELLSLREAGVYYESSEYIMKFPGTRI